MTFDLKKTITEVLLVLSLYLILFFIWWRFQPLIKAMTDIEDIFDGYILRDIVDIPKEITEQHKKRECLRGAVDKGNLLGIKLTYGRADKANKETINKTNVE